MTGLISLAFSSCGSRLMDGRGDARRREPSLAAAPAWRSLRNRAIKAPCGFSLAKFPLADPF